MKKWQIQALFFGGDWECVEECPIFYDTKEEAQIELEDHITDMEYAVEMGYLEDCDAHAWRVAEVEVE